MLSRRIANISVREPDSSEFAEIELEKESFHCSIGHCRQLTVLSINQYSAGLTAIDHHVQSPNDEVFELCGVRNALVGLLMYAFGTKMRLLTRGNAMKATTTGAEYMQIDG